METRSNKVFVYDKLRVFFKHTDYHGFIHPYNFLEWTGYVREAFFSEMCVDFRELLNSPIKMMTTKIIATYYNDGLFGDELEARLSTSKIKKVSCDIIVRFFNKRTGKISCTTWHTLVFVDSDTQQFTTIPRSIREAVSNFQDIQNSDKTDEN